MTVAAGKLRRRWAAEGTEGCDRGGLKDCSVTEVTIRSGKEKVTAFGGKSITLYLPVEKQGV